MQSIEKNIVHVWFSKLECDKNAIDENYRLLSVHERDRADRFVVDHARQHYISATATVRKILSPYLNVRPNLIEFNRSEKGKPFFKKTNPLHFNISHSADRLLVALANDYEVGVDIEHCSPISALELAERFFTPQECQQLLRIDPNQQLTYFYRLWTLKEAFIKATGEGLSFGLDQFIVDMQDNAMNALLSIKGDRQAAAQWSLGLLTSPWADYTAAIAVEGKPSGIKAFSFVSSACS